MKTISKTILGWTLCSIALAACGSSKHSSTGSTEQVRIQADAQNMDAEQLALAGEQLMAPHSFMLADKVFIMALAKDGTNQRATFYHNFLKPLMLLQGSAKRISPLAQDVGRSTQLAQEITKIPNSSGRDFLLNGTADLNTADDAQAVVAQYTQAVFDLYDYLKANQTMTITLNMNPFVFRDEIQQRRDDSCTINEDSDQRVDVVCDNSQILQTKINSADMIALRQLIAGDALYSMIYSTYSISGAEALLPVSQTITGKEAFNKMTAIPAFGKLRADNKLGRLVALGSDFSVAWKWVLKNQSRLCPAADANGIRRKGFLFERGICTDPSDQTYSSQQSVALLDKLLAGPAQVTLSNWNGARVTTVNPVAIVNSPIQDLKSLNPYLNRCGDIMTQNKTLGGLLPKGDADDVLNVSGCR